MRRHVALRILILSVGLTFLPSVARAPAAQDAGPPAPQGTAASQEAGGGEPVVLSLREVLTAALENNLDIIVRRYDPLKSEALVTVQGSAFDPLLTGSASSSQDQETRHQLIFNTITSMNEEFTFPSTSKLHNYSFAFEDPLVIGGKYRLDIAALDNIFAGTSFNPTAFTIFPFETTAFETSWKVTYTQSLLRNLGPKTNRWQIIVAENDLGQSESQFRQTVIDTLSAAEKAYWDLHFALMDLRTKRGSLQLAKDFLEQNRIKVRVGTLAPIEITQAEAGVADREEGVIVAEYAVRTAEDSLHSIMNVPRDSPDWSRPIAPSDPPPLNEVTPDMAESVAAAEKDRPDLEQARLALRSRETELAYRRNQKRWGLDLEGAYGRAGVSGILADQRYAGAYDNLREDYQEDWSATLTLSVPVGNRQAEANFINAEHALSQAQYDLQRLEQAARVEVRNAVRKVETDLKRVKAAQVNVRLQREKLAAEQKKFENGMSTSFQVLQFQTDLATAETRENLAIVDYNKSLAELERVKGTLLEARQMLLPRQGAEEADESEPAGEGSGRSAAPRGLWSRVDDRLTWDAAAWAAPGSADRALLPEAFVFDGRRIVGRGRVRPGAPLESTLP